MTSLNIILVIVLIVIFLTIIVMFAMLMHAMDLIKTNYLFLMHILDEIFGDDEDE